MADVVVINKEDTAEPESVEKVRASIRALNPRAAVVDAESPMSVDGGEALRGKRVLVVEDGPTVTHGGMRYGSGMFTARKYGAKELVDPRPFVQGKIAETFRRYPLIGALLPSVGYGEEQMRDLELTIRRVPCDIVLIATPVDLTKIIDIDKPMLRVSYELKEIGGTGLKGIIEQKLRIGLAGRVDAIGRAAGKNG
jgi:predicted GTPase